ncbi:hypothetical protein Rsub_02926 [Raphidocelis subcapitata]|uniref:Rhodanese domain-containing protein n=1 Tax=Raphidocelis subcapitata TaxID=307507 RepID=A0A2V0NQ49_9CHLO|nr:hypothetical protein Rsub_02926 [Raphidocelis subcapitata]|eukprot:GBF89756.1 hypothetical protein Rsub_02926 [Raphidocelis subcapitata]
MSSDAPHPILSAAETQQLVEKAGVPYIDVRTPHEFAEGHVPKSLNVPVALEGAAGPHDHDKLEPNPAFVEEVRKLFPDTKAEVIVACGAGRRAARAAALLSEAGYTGVKVFRDGMKGWTAEGLAVEKPGA